VCSCRRSHSLMTELLNKRHVPDALFATDNDLGIPLLDASLQADYCHLPVMPWGAVKRNQVMPGTWHFYVDDYRFEALWSDPSPVLNSRCRAAVEPNFTTSEQMPFAVGWYQIYRKRWIARWWQSQGLPVFVDLNVAPDFYYANLLGVPDGWKAFLTRGYADKRAWLDVEYDLACDKRGSEDLLFAVYGGGAAVERHCQSKGYLWIPEAMDCRKGKTTHGEIG
jgi:hypothetical protein